MAGYPATASCGDFFRLKEIRNANCPVLAIFGSIDDYESEPGKKLEILKSKVKDCDTKLFSGANHWFSGRESELGKAISNWIKSTAL